MESNTDNTPKGTGGSEPIVPPRKPSSVAKWQAITVVLILAVAALAVAYALKSPSSSSSTTGPSLPSISGYTPTATLGQSYGFDISVNSSFSNATFYFGDGTHTTYTATNVSNGMISVSHKYNTAGEYYIYYTMNFGKNMLNNAQSLIPLTVSPTITADQAIAQFSVNVSSSSSQAIKNTNIYYPGAFFTYFIGYTDINNSSYSVASQSYATLLNDVAVPSLSGTVNLSSPIYTVNNAETGVYEVLITTTTGTGNASVGFSNLTTTTFMFDLPVFGNPGVYTAPIFSTTSTFTNDEVVPSGFKTLDGAIGYDTVSYELMSNIYQYLVQYNGSSNGSFFPELATNLPSAANGEISSNNMNYTFTIRANATWQDGTPVTAYDVYYSFVRTLLFDAGQPGTPGWIIAQVLLPGDYYTSNTYQNITTALTYDNSTNSITFHFVAPETPTYIFQLLASSGDFIMNANWLIAHGAGITFTQAGFNAYKAQGNAVNYNQYVQFHAMADGPYMIEYVSPGSEVVLVANPDFQSPGPWYPAAKETTVNIVYVSTYNTAVLNLESGSAQTAAGIPTTVWSQVLAMQNNHIINIYPVPTLDIYWFNINANVNLTMLSALYPTSNLPATLFTSLAMRQVLSYTFNYQYYINQQLGNKVYNTIFGANYAGMLPTGMLYAQNLSNLVAAGAPAPTFDLITAHHYWSQFINSSANAVFGITSNGMYNGKQLSFPIITFDQDPVDEAAAATWASNLSQVIFGTSADSGQFPVAPTSFVNLLGYMVQGQNPAPIYELGWAPDYPNPTDYMGPMALPINSSTYPGANDFTPYWFNGNASNPTPNGTEAATLTTMVNEYANGTNATLPQAKQQAAFQQMNENLVNMSFYVYLFQAYGFQLISSKVPSNVVYQDLENVMISASGYLYNYFYTT